MLRYLIAIPLIAHGLANLGGAFAPWTKNLIGFKDEAWVFSRAQTFGSATGRSFSLLWLASSICLITAGAGLLTSQPWWSAVTLAGCSLSFLSILPWWKAVVPGARFGALFDAFLIVLLTSPIKEQILAGLP